MFTIDGVNYDVRCEIEREAEIRDSQISGTMMDGTIFHDVLGTYMSYDVTLTMPLRNRGRYADLIEQLTEPVEGHTFILPYNGDTITLVGKVERPADVWEKLESGYTYWSGLKFTISANAPTKMMTLEGAITRGVLPPPPIENHEIGDTYQWTSSGWLETTGLPNAELMAFPREE